MINERSNTSESSLSVKCLAAIAVTIISFFLIILFRQVPSQKFWDSYSLLYVPVQCSDEIVLDALQENKIEGYIALSKQYIPMKLAESSPEYSMLLLNKDKSEFSYLYDRNKYFFDKENQFRVYYIPSQYRQKLSGVLDYLNKWNVSANIDAQNAYPFIIPLICLILCIIFSIFSKNTIIFVLSAIFPVLFVFCNPFYPVGLSCCLILLVLLFNSNLWGRKGAFYCLLNKYFIPVILFVSLICGFSVSIKSGIINLFTYIGAASILYNCYEFENFIHKRQSFSPVFIRPAKFISLYSGKAVVIANTVLISSLLLAGSFFLSDSSLNVKGNNSGKIYLPAADGNSFVAEKNESGSLPQLEDYYRWSWNVTTYPYRSINDSMSDEDMIVYSRYNEENGLIKKTDFVFKYDDAYKNSVYETIDDLNFDSIESLLKSQKSDSVSGYSSSGEYQITGFYMVMCLICIFILLFLYISIMITKGVRK